MNKRGITYQVVVIVIIMLVVFIVLMKLDLHIWALVNSFFEGGICAYSAIFSSFGKFAGAETFKISCPQRFVTVVMTEEEVFKGEKENKNEKYFEIDYPIRRSQRKKLAEWYKTISSHFEKEEVYKEYRMNEIMAREMKKCWNSLGRGELDLFSSWFSKVPVKYEEGTFKEHGSTVGNILRGFQIWKLRKDLTRKACVICSRVRFDNRVKTQFPGQIISLGEWMRYNPANTFSAEPKSYYEFLLDETIPSDFFAKESDQNRLYYTTDKDQAIVFMRMNVHALVEAGSDILDILPGFAEEDHKQAIDAVFITPYFEVADKCDIIVN